MEEKEESVERWAGSMRGRGGKEELGGKRKGGLWGTPGSWRLRQPGN